MKYLLALLILIGFIYPNDVNQFACEFFDQLQKEKNPLFSPISIYSCMGMAYLGAREATAQEMMETLKFPAEFPKPLTNVMASLPSTFILANSSWVDGRISLIPQYSAIIKDALAAEIHAVKFSQPKETALLINSWINEKTEGRIPALLTDHDISPNTRLILTNAVYFQGKWTKSFDARHTREAPFFIIPELSKSVPMMEQKGYFRYGEDENAQWVSLSFQGSRDIVCTVCLPKEGVHLKLTPSMVTESLKKMETRQLCIQIPRFEVRMRTPCIPLFQQMGLSDPFSSRADFSGIDGTRDLYINAVLHDAFFSLDEGGVSATAATGVVMNLTSMLPSEKEITSFIANRPFYYFLLDGESETLLFMGKLESP